MQHGQMAFHFRIYYQITYTTLVPFRHCALLNKNNDNALSLFFKKVMNNAISLIMQEKVMHYH